MGGSPAKGPTAGTATGGRAFVRRDVWRWAAGSPLPIDAVATGGGRPGPGTRSAGRHTRQLECANLSKAIDCSETLCYNRCMLWAAEHCHAEPCREQPTWWLAASERRVAVHTARPIADAAEPSRMGLGCVARRLGVPGAELRLNHWGRRLGASARLGAGSGIVRVESRRWTQNVRRPEEAEVRL